MLQSSTQRGLRTGWLMDYLPLQPVSEPEIAPLMQVRVPLGLPAYPDEQATALQAVPAARGLPRGQLVT